MGEATTSPAAARQHEGWVSVAPKLGFVGAFDGIRGIGVCMVLVGHALFGYVESWVTIVDTFFVLSGFLIATLLLQEARSTGTIDLRKFFIRRGVRLLPSVWLFCSVWLVLAAVGQAVGIEGVSFTETLKDAVAAVTYLYHVVFPNGLYTIHPGQQNHRTMWHLWTLSVEEHFYFVIPGLTLWCLRRRQIKALGVVMAGGAVAIGVARLLAYTGPSVTDSTPGGIRLAFLQRPDALMIGVALAVLNAHVTAEMGERIRRPMLIAAHVGLVVWLAMLNLSSELVHKLGGPYVDYLPATPAASAHSQLVGHWYWFRFGHSLGALAFAVVLFSLSRYPQWWLVRLWSWRFFRWMGRLSYTLYVWHALPYLLIIVATGGEDTSLGTQLVRTPILIASAFAVSIPVFYLVEMRVLKMKLRFASEAETVDLRTGTVVRTPGSPDGADSDR